MASTSSGSAKRPASPTTSGSEVALEESVAIYERGEALKRRCEELLRQAEARVDKITTDVRGRPTGIAPLDVPS